jgi:hypothetical protein
MPSELNYAAKTIDACIRAEFISASRPQALCQAPCKYKCVHRLTYTRIHRYLNLRKDASRLKVLQRTVMSGSVQVEVPAEEEERETAGMLPQEFLFR